jgi:hypothetical protein
MTMGTYFRTRNLTAAAFISATQALRFIRCEAVNDSGQFVFCFDDPGNAGPALELEAMGGAMVSAVAFHAAVRNLRSFMTASQQQNRSDDNYGNRNIRTRY